MSSEWFYIRQWHESKKEHWAVVDKNKLLIKKDLTKYDAKVLSSKLNDNNLSTFVVHNDHIEYNNSNNILEEANENSRTRERM
tara:strand:+ start:1505 stop:1753 length:249 start_codon:yes stop_codon:yes gene_type:complete